MITTGLENLPCEERLGELGLSGLEKQWLLGGDLTAACRCLRGDHHSNKARLYPVVCNGKTRGTVEMKSSD